MSLRKTDLNLLVILDALLDEAHVSRAAQRINLSQPATSAALERCRQLFDDPLLIRSRGGMILTPKADRLHHRLKQVLVELEDVLESRDEDLQRIEQTLRLSMSDAYVASLGPKLAAYLGATAPGVNLVFLPWVGPGAALEQLVKGQVDLAISQFPQVQSSISRRELAHEDYRIILRKDHPALARFDLDTWLALPHLIMSGRGETRTGLDLLLEGMGRKRRVAMVVPSFNLALPLLQQTELVSMLPVHGVPRELFAEFELLPPPVDMPGYTVHLAWHRRLDGDRVTGHVADFIAGECFPLDAAGTG
ncbi:LysR family transcriptional regulator [Seongchinamella unica]|uniref:LysR family transcriptional regulator n=1 Tax=Seongchinamella unica TaxID=2547392 RepID=A0A4R5LW32_9GAMM|nr:LysR family transcriptional regulator [Seongchinamella unica]TDG15669.1 LysR family transcriptional regulator [Seongchinamella unica]